MGSNKHGCAVVVNTPYRLGICTGEDIGSLRDDDQRGTRCENSANNDYGVRRGGAVNI